MIDIIATIILLGLSITLVALIVMEQSKFDEQIDNLEKTLEELEEILNKELVELEVQIKEK